MTDKSQQLTGLLVAWSQGDAAAMEQLMPMVYQELRRMASRRLAVERQNHTLDSVALVHEAYLRLIDQRSVNWQNRAHFFAIAARLMRRILVDYARARKVAKRGGGMLNVSLTGSEAALATSASEMIEVDQALTRLAAIDPRKCEVVELRFFAGLSIEETACILHISVNTVARDWNVARAWLHRELCGAAFVGSL